MRVMNVKFVGRIIMTVLFVFICIGAHAGDDPLKYEIEGEGVGAQGTYLVKVTVIQKKSKLDADMIKKDFPARLHAPGRNLWQEVWW